MSITSFIAALVACAVVIAVSVYFIVRQVKQNKQRAERLKEGEEHVREERQKRIDSILIIMKAIEEDDRLTWTEACIRVKNLLDQLSLDLSDHEDIKAIYLIEEKTQHIPTHQQWNDLPSPARTKFRLEMDTYEAEHIEQLRRAKVALLSYAFV